MMADGWKITIHGGFAWVFDEPPGNGGTANHVTVGPYHKAKTHKEGYHPHKMVLRVPADARDPATTLNGNLVDDYYEYVLKGDVTLNAEATGVIRRTLHENKPADWDSFYWVYDADRFADRSGNTRTRLVNGWGEKLDARLVLRGGRLKVLPPRFPGVYVMTARGATVDQPLATHIEYHPEGWGTPTTNVEFHAGNKVVVVRPTLPDGGPTHLDIAADCGCSNDADLGDIPGFDVTFGLYGAPAPEFKPKCTRFASPGAFVPSSDCPPRAYSRSI